MVFAKHVGIKLFNLDDSLKSRIPTAAAVVAGSVMAMGRRAFQILRLAANVSDPDTVTIGPDVYEIEIVAIDTLINTSGGELNNTTDPAGVTITGHGLSAGDPFRVESEIMTVLAVIDANRVLAARGRFGTTIATHADGLDIFKGNGVTAGRIPVGFNATFTPAVAGPALAAAINNAVAADGQRPTGKVSTIFNRLNAVSLAAGAEVLVFGITEAAITDAVAETLAGAGNAWDAAALAGGQAQGDRKSFFAARVPVAAEVTAGRLQFPMSFTPTYVNIVVRVTATGIVKAWDGGFTFASGVLTLDNAGVTDWAATDTVYVAARE